MYWKSRLAVSKVPVLSIPVASRCTKTIRQCYTRLGSRRANSLFAPDKIMVLEQEFRIYFVIYKRVGNSPQHEIDRAFSQLSKLRRDCLRRCAWTNDLRIPT